MAKKVLLDAQLSINSNDLTQWTSKVELTAEFEEKDVTTFSNNEAKAVLGGLESSSIGITFKNSHTAGELDDIMWALRRQVVSFTTRADADAVSTSNPQYSGNILINQWSPIMGSVGDVNEFDVTFPLSGPLARATSTS